MRVSQIPLRKESFCVLDVVLTWKSKLQGDVAAYQAGNSLNHTEVDGNRVL